jgi:hypothetical protein
VPIKVYFALRDILWKLDTDVTVQLTVLSLNMRCRRILLTQRLQYLLIGVLYLTHGELLSPLEVDTAGEKVIGEITE